MILGSAASFVYGGHWMWFGFAALLIVGVGGELISGDDTNEPTYKHGWICDWIAYSILPCLIIAAVAFVWAVSPRDVLHIGDYVGSNFGIDVLGRRSLNSWIDYLGGALSLGGVLGVQGIIVAHELTHRTEDPVAMFFGRWIFALMFGTNLATEHVFGHHANLGFAEVDPVSVKRGTGYYTFLTKGAWDQWHHGWCIEKARLNAAGKSAFSFHNRIVQAWIRGSLVLGLIAYGAGFYGFMFYLIAITYSKIILEGLNYFSHYGIVRERGQSIGVRHTFSSNNAIGNMIIFNLGRHGAHHAEGNHYQDLKAYPEMPQSPFGYITMTVISWIPPLFFKIMLPVVKDWDEKYATPKERQLAETQNRESGLPYLTGHTAIPAE
jgi:hypothetical protein